MSGIKMDDNMSSTSQAKDVESQAVSGAEHTPHNSAGEQNLIGGNGDETPNSESSDSKKANEQKPERPEEQKETTTRPRRSSQLADAIEPFRDILLALPKDTSTRPSDRERGSYPLNPAYLTDSYISTNPERLSSRARAVLKTRKDSYQQRDHTYKPNLGDGGRHKTERSGRDTDAFIPTVRRRKAQYHQEQEKNAPSPIVSSTRKQTSQDVDEVVPPESSAQGAQRELAYASRTPNPSNSVNEGNHAELVTGGREGTTIKEKSINTNNNSTQSQSSRTTFDSSQPWDFDVDRHQPDPPPNLNPPSVPRARISYDYGVDRSESGTPPNSNPQDNESLDVDRHQFGTPPNSNPQSVPRPLATPSQQHQGTQSNINEDDRSSEIMLPRWQPDSEVEECPICHKVFGFFCRKHHCRKCGRVVCNACSPHRITIPYQYIVQPPVGFDEFLPDHARTRSRTISQNYIHDSGTGGGMKVRLCNPCVPDPNISPPPIPALDRPLPPLPHSSNASLQPPTRTSSNRERVRRSELCPICGDRLPPSTMAIENHIDRCINRRLRDVELSAATPAPRTQTTGPSEQVGGNSSSLPLSSNAFFRSTRPRHTSEATTLGNPGVTLNNLQQSNRNNSASPATSEAAPSRPFLSSRMISFLATRLDTTGDDNECIICMEDFEEGVEMARLECLCKYHKKCIDGWFYKHPGRCPVHGQDNY